MKHLLLIIISLAACYEQVPVENPYQLDDDQQMRGAIERCIGKAVQLCNTERDRLESMTVEVGPNGKITNVGIGSNASLRDACVARTLVGMTVERDLISYHGNF